MATATTKKTATEMAIIADTTQLREAVSRASRLAPRSGNPALECVRITADQESLRIKSTDTQIWLCETLAACEVTQPGSTAVPAAKLAAVLGRIAAPTVSMSVKLAEMEIDGGTAGRFSLATLPVRDMPQLPDSPESDGALVIAGDELADALRRASIACSRQEHTRYAICGLLLAAGKRDTLDVVGTDGHRLARQTMDAKANCNAIVPRKAVEMLASMAGPAEQEVSLTFGQGRMLAACEGWEIGASLIEGSFPPYKDVIPKENKLSVTVDRAAMLDALRSASLMTDFESKGVRFEIGEHGMDISARSESGRAKISLEAEISGEAIAAIGFNPHYLIEALKVISEEHVRLELSAPNKPGVLVAGNFTYVIMPVSLT